MPVADDREVALGRAQVLPDGEDLDAVLAQVVERVAPRRAAGLHVAAAAPAGARVPADHERRRAPLPALADVRAGGLLAHRVKVLALELGPQLAVAPAAGRGDLEPRRLAPPERLHVGAEDLEDVAPAGVGARACRHGTDATRRPARDAAPRAAGGATRGAAGGRTPGRSARPLACESTGARPCRSPCARRSCARGRARTARPTRTAAGR